MDPILAALVFVASIILLVKGADWLVENASAVGKHLHISPLVIGLTVVAIGTSLPEFFVSIFGAISGSGDISIGNVVGSNIANIGLVIGCAALIFPMTLREKTLLHEFPFLLVSGFLLLVLANDNNIFGINSFTIGRFDGFVLVATLLVFGGYVYRTMKMHRAEKKVEQEFKEEYSKSVKWLGKHIALIILGIVCLVIGGRLLVSAGVDLAMAMGVSEKFIGLTLVALGTSLPELFATGVAAFKRKADIAVGNIVGSNILNILFVVGVTGLAKPFTMSPSLVYFDMIIMVALSFMFLTFAITKKVIDRHEGAILLASYIVYIAYLFFML